MVKQSKLVFMYTALIPEIFILRKQSKILSSSTCAK